MLCDDLEGGIQGGKEFDEEGDICIHIDDSLPSTAETNTIL